MTKGPEKKKKTKRSVRAKKMTGDPMSALREDLHATEDLLSDVENRSEVSEGPLRKLLSIVEHLSTTHDVDAVLRLAAKRIIEIFEAERVFLIEYMPPDQLTFRFAISFDGGPIPAPEKEISFAVVREVSKGLAPLLIADATSDQRFANVSSVRNLQLHSVMAAPLMALGELKGVVYADNRRLSGVFTQRSLDLLGLFGNHIGVAVNNAQLFGALTAARAELAQAERLKAIGQIAAFVAHEIKNPLASLYLLVGMMREHWEEEAMRKRFFGVVPGELDRLNKSVTKLLGYSRPTPLTKAAIHITPLVESAFNLMEPRTAEQSVEVVRNFSTLPQVLADGERLREVFVNVITNAIEAMIGRTNKRIEVTLKQIEADKVHMIFRDTGPGIPEADFKAVFDPFYTKKQTGSGMGLAYCQKLVREHGGNISADNAEDGGARFTITLPVYGS
jgi:signal transduction histidine kinase